MKKPNPYGLFHIISIVIVISLSLILSLFFKDSSDETFRIIIFIFSVLVILFEIIKQFFYYFVVEPKRRYKVYFTPYQFCSLALYIYPLIVFLPSSNFRDYLIIFSSTYIILGGILLYIYPTTFTKYSFINFQTMFHHGSQIVVGIFIFIHEYKKFNYKNFVFSILIVLVAFIVAFIINELYPLLKEDNNKLNLFYISRYIDNEVPIFDKIYKKSYPLFLFLYISLFIVAGSIIFFIFKLITLLL